MHETVTMTSLLLVLVQGGGTQNKEGDNLKDVFTSRHFLYSL